MSDRKQCGQRTAKPGPGSRWRDLWVNLGLLLVSGILGLGLCETYFRLFAPCRLYGIQYQAPQIHFFTYDELLGWRGRPNAAGPFGSIDFLVQVQLDSLGNRSSTRPLVQGKQNVLVLGDSFGWGWGVENDELFSEVMMLRDPDLNVYNLSAPGYGPDQQYLQLTRFLENRSGDRFDHCVLVLCLANDFDYLVDKGNFAYPKPRFYMEEGELQLDNVPVPWTQATEYGHGRQVQRVEQIPIGPLNRLHSWNRFTAWRHLRGWKRVQADSEGRTSNWPAEALADLERERKALMTALLRSIRGTCVERAMGFSVVVIHDREPGPRLEWLVKVLETEQVDFLLFNQYASRWRARSLFVDPHLNAYGHHVLAEQIIELVKTS